MDRAGPANLMAPMMLKPRPTAFLNARLVDPESGYDGPGALVVADGLVADVVHQPTYDGLSADIDVIDCAGAMLAPGLVDLRVKTGEPGAEPKETLKSAARAAAAGGVTSIVVQPDTDPVVDEPSVVDFILRRARDIGLVHVYPAGAATKGLEGRHMAEIGLMREAGAVYITDVDKPVVDSLVLRRVLSYARGFDALVAHRPADPYLTAGAAATEGEFAARLGISVPTLRRLEQGDASAQVGHWLAALEVLGRLGDAEALLAPRYSLFDVAAEPKPRQRARRRT